jgi:hypothetical protein
MGTGYSGYDATGGTPSEAIENLMYEIGESNYQFSPGGNLMIKKTTVLGSYVTNVVVLDRFEIQKRATINKIIEDGHYFYRAWFGLDAYGTF